MFCENCGAELRQRLCPACGARVGAGEDLCEACRAYIAQDRCSFCGAPLSDGDANCPECGAPRSGMECPVCHGVSRFAFCPSCGSAVTEAARAELDKAWDVPFRRRMAELEQEMERLWMTQPAAGPAERRLRERNYELRGRVLRLLAEDGEQLYDPSRETAPILDEAELGDMAAAKRKQLQALLDSMATPAQDNPAAARLHAMARKPLVSRLGWRCNYRDALHPSPLGCACPQKGGKWVVLEGETRTILGKERTGTR